MPALLAWFEPRVYTWQGSSSADASEAQEGHFEVANGGSACR